jgi:hypothetical protein
MHFQVWTCINTSLRLNLFGTPSSRGLLFLGLAKYIPSPIRVYMATSGSSPRIVRAKEHEKLALATARELLEMKSQELLGGDSQKDVMSLIGILPFRTI